MTDDDDPTPPRLPRAPSVLRAKTQDDRRYTEGAAARKAREAVPEPINWDGLTDRYEGEELATRRADRPTPYRLASLEKRASATEERQRAHDTKLDGVATTANVTAATVARVEGRLGGQDLVLDNIQKSLNRALDDKSHATKVQRDDQQDLTINKRARWTTLLKFLMSGAAVEILHRLGVL